MKHIKKELSFLLVFALVVTSLVVGFGQLSAAAEGYSIITFNANGGLGGTSASMPYGATLTAPVVSRIGYTFAGWSPEVPPTVPATDTVYIAQWTANQYTVTFDALGGTVSPATSTVTYGSTYGEGTGGLPTPRRFARNFLYWYANIDGNVITITDTTTVTADAAHTLYARWNASSSTGAWTTGYFTHTGATQAKISRYTGPSGGHLTIPSTLDGIPVTSLGYRTSYLFDEWPFMTRCPATLSLPATITHLDFMAFSDTDALSAIYFWGDAPEVDTSFSSNTKIYYLAGRTGYTTPTWQGRPCEPFNGVTINFDANGGTGGTSALTIAGLPLSAPTVTKPGYVFAGWSPAVPATVPAQNTTYTALWNVAPNHSVITFAANGGAGGVSNSLPQGDPLTPPTVSKPGYVFAGWSPAVPATVPAQNTTYTAQYYAMPAVRVTKLADGFKVAVTNPQADYRYQIWSYQQLTGDLLGDGTVSQWVLSKPYTLGANGTAEGDGSAGFTIPDFTSNDGNYTVAVRIADASSNYLGEVRDTYTQAAVSEVKITKVLVDGDYSTGTEIREIKPGASMTFMVVGNGVPGTVCSALVEQPDTPPLTVNSAIAFTWNIAGMAPGTYTMRFTAGNGVTSDTRTLRVQLYSLDTAIQYGRIDALTLNAPEGPALPKTMTLAPDIENGSFYYRVGEPGRKAMFTSGLFDPGNTAEYTFTKYGIYQVASFVNREYEVRIGGFYDDGIIQNFTVRRSDTEPSSVTLTADGVNLNDPIQKSTALTFEANAQIGGIGATPVEYSYWRQDAKGYALVRDWSADNTLEWTAARVGIYVFEVRAKGADAGSYEVAKSVRVTVTDTEEDFARDVVITLNEDDLSAATARVPITLKANATSSNSEDLLYRFHVYDSAMGTRTLQNYSAAQHCVWTPRKAGTYTVSVLVKNQASFGAYDAMQTFTVTVN